MKIGFLVISTKKKLPTMKTKSFLSLRVEGKMSVFVNEFSLL